MDTQTLIQALRDFQPEDFDWKFALYNAKKSKDGMELSFFLCEMKRITDWIEVIISTLLEKTLVDRSVTPYTPFLPKEEIGALEAINPLIHEKLFDISRSIEGALTYAPEDFVSGVLPKITGYAFYGVRTIDEQKESVLFLRRSNPFLVGQRTRLCTSLGNEIIESEKPLLKFTSMIDFLSISGNAFFISPAAEKDFDMENRHFAICAKRLQDIGDAGAVSDFEALEKSAMSAKHVRKFVDFDAELLAYIMQLSVLERIDFLATYGIAVDENGRMDTQDAEACELVIDLLCCRSCLDPMGRLSVGSNITPR